MAVTGAGSSSSMLPGRAAKACAKASACSASPARFAVPVLIALHACTCASIGESGIFNINLLRDPSSELAMRFAGAGGATGEEKFTAGDWDEDARGLGHAFDEKGSRHDR